MKSFDEMTPEEMQAYIMGLYERMTPENKEKARAYYCELIAEQEATK